MRTDFLVRRYHLVVALVVAAVAVSFLLMAGGCSELEGDRQADQTVSDSSPTTLGVSIATMVDAGDPDSQWNQIVGAAEIERIEGDILFMLDYGSKPGQITYWDPDAPDGTFDLMVAVSPDGATIGICDDPMTVKLFSRGGEFLKSVAFGEIWPIDMALGPGGQVYLATGDMEGALHVAWPDDTQSEIVLGSDSQWDAGQIFVDGADVWVCGYGPFGEGSGMYEVIRDGAPVPAAELVLVERYGVPADGRWYELMGDSFERVLVMDMEGPNTLTVNLVPGVVPPSLHAGESFFDSWGLIGSDAQGDAFGAIEIFPEDGPVTESTLIFGLTPQGTSLGSIRVPWDAFSSWDWAVTPDGKIIELRTTEDGVEIIEHTLRK